MLKNILLSLCVILIGLNFITPKTFQYGYWMCDIEYITKFQCYEDICQQYVYKLTHSDLHIESGTYLHKCYNNVGCEVPNTMRCLSTQV